MSSEKTLKQQLQNRVIAIGDVITVNDAIEEFKGWLEQKRQPYFVKAMNQNIVIGIPEKTPELKVFDELLEELNQ